MGLSKPTASSNAGARMPCTDTVVRMHSHYPFHVPDSYKTVAQAASADIHGRVYPARNNSGDKFWEACNGKSSATPPPPMAPPPPLSGPAHESFELFKRNGRGKRQDDGTPSVRIAITLDSVKQCRSLSIIDMAKVFGIALTSMKKALRHLKINNWAKWRKS